MEEPDGHGAGTVPAAGGSEAAAKYYRYDEPAPFAELGEAQAEHPGRGEGVRAEHRGYRDAEEGEREPDQHHERGGPHPAGGPQETAGGGGGAGEAGARHTGVASGTSRS